MEIDLGEDYEERVREIANDMEESGKDVGEINSPSREIKGELIDREMEKSFVSTHRKRGDGKVSSDSAEEGERLIIDDSIYGENFMI